jgi:hypothetical protein
MAGKKWHNKKITQQKKTRQKLKQNITKLPTHTKTNKLKFD